MRSFINRLFFATAALFPTAALAGETTPIEDVFALVDLTAVETQVMSLAGVAILIVLVAFAIRIVRRFLR